jgi:hypothetical protein
MPTELVASNGRNIHSSGFERHSRMQVGGRLPESSWLAAGRYA